jgi:hypothetical protein
VRERVGVAVTTYQSSPERARFCKEALGSIWQHAGYDVLVVVNDGSPDPVEVPEDAVLVVHDQPRGVAAAKNACLAALEDHGVEHAFLLDDDFCPSGSGNAWWECVESPMPYMASSSAGGSMQYVHLPTVLPVVGGFDTSFGRWGGEHIDFARRIYAVGLTPCEFPTIRLRERWLDLDAHGLSSVTTDEKGRWLPRVNALLARYDGRRAFIPYRV